MKTNLTYTLFTAALVAALSIVPQAVHAQIYATSFNGGTVGEYNLDGSTVNNSLISGLSNPYGITASGSTLYVGDAGEVTTYNLNGTGGSTFATGLGGYVSGIAVSGGIVYVSDRTNGVIDEYSASTKLLLGSFSDAGTSGAGGVIVDGSNLIVSSLSSGTVTSYNLVAGLGTTVGATTLASGLNLPTGLALTGNGSDLFINEFGGSSIDDYNFGTMTLTQPVTGLVNGPGGVAISGSDLYIDQFYGDEIDEFTLSGTPVGTNPLTTDGLSSPFGLAIADVPEPGTVALMGLAGLAFLIVRRRHSTI